jgi:glutamate formiminotransferase/formiminotetrahydrofolate cyclodeaminase
MGKAGATVIGARQPLIAFNVYLTSGDVKIAKRIARAVRHSSGGLRYVKALGLLVERQAQVSMNLTDFTRTPVERVVEMIRREAQRHGVAIDRSELVGLIPQAALNDAARWYLQLDEFEADQILETRLRAAMRAQPSFLDRLAQASATPGGGAAAAYAGGMAAALVAMVAKLTMDKERYAEVSERMREIAGTAEDLRGRLEMDVERDVQAFNQVMAAYRMSKQTEAQKQARENAIEDALHTAAQVPLEMAERVVMALEFSAEVAEKGNVNAISDAGSAGAMARAALQSASLNVRTNAASVKNKAAAEKWLGALETLLARAAEAQDRLSTAIRERGSL